MNAYAGSHTAPSTHRAPRVDKARFVHFVRAENPAKLKKQKNALMQDLLTGKVRVDTLFDTEDQPEIK